MVKGREGGRVGDGVGEGAVDCTGGRAIVEIYKWINN